MATQRHFPFSPIAAAVSALLAAPGVFAQAPAQRETTLPEVKVQGASPADDYAPGASTIGGKTPTPVRDIPQSLTVINRPVIESQGAATLTQTLRNVPGITLSAGEGGQIGDNVNLRGFSARTDLFLDGMRDRGQYTRDSFFLDSVEVLKGPSSMLFGRGSTGGVINQVSKKPRRAPSAEGELTLGTDNYRRATIDLNRPLGETSAFRIAALAHDADSTRDVVESKRFGVAPSLRLGIGTPTEITLSALIQHSRDIPDYGFPLVAENAGGAGTTRRPVNAPPNAFYGYADDRFDQDVTLLGATVQHRISPALTLRNQTTLSWYELDASPSPLSAPTVVGGGVPTLSTPLALLQAPRQDRDRRVKDTAVYNQTDLIAKFQAAGVQHTLTTGIELGWDDYDFTRHGWTPTNVNINLGNPVNGTRTGARTLQQQQNTSADSFAAYVNDQIDLNRQWKVVAGLRWDRFDASSNVTNYNLATGAVTSASSFSHLDTFWSTRAGVIYQPTALSSYYVSYGTSSNPSAETVTQSAATAALDPEKNRSYEAGAKWDVLGGDLSVNTAVFRVEKTNARSTDPLTGLQVLTGKARVDGFEVGAAGRLGRLWQVFGGYTFLDGRILRSDDVGTGLDAGLREEGKILPNTPRHTATLWTTYRFAPSWEAGAGVVASGKRYLNNFETAVTDGYTRFDAMLAYRQPKYDVRLNVHNLTDEVYFETASGGRATPVEGRKVLLSLVYRM